jgi:outer membrane protein TolC
MRLQASLPLFTGFSRTATRSQAGLELDRLNHQRSAVVQGVTQRVRARLEIAAASHAAITLTREAAEAAGRNLELVTDAYASGAVSITSLIDAQNAARTSAEAAANAVHDFLLDLMQVERAMGAFGALLSQEERAVFAERLITLAREKAQ